MKAFETAGYTLLGLISLLVMLYIIIRIIVYNYDRTAIKLAREYCKQNHYIFKRVALYPNQYGLHFSNKNGHYYATYYIIKAEKRIIWTRGLPQEIINSGLNQIPFGKNTDKTNAADNLKSVG